MSNNPHLKKELGLITMLGLGIGSILGSGIFGLPAVMGAVAGPSLITAIVIAAIITFFLGMPYAELGATYPMTGGPYSFPRKAMGDLGGFLMGWGYFLYLFIGTAAIIDIFVMYLGFYIPGLAVGDTLTPLGITIAVASIWIFTFINIFGVKWGGIYGVVTTIGKLIPLAIFFFVGLAYIKGDNFIPYMPFGFTGVTLAVALFFWSFTGFEAITIPGEEIKNPSRTIPLAMIFTIVIVAIVYCLIAFVFVGIIDWASLGVNPGDWKAIGKLASPIADVAKAIKLPWLAAIAAIGAIIATGGAGGSWVLFQARLPYAMAKDKLFWAPVSKVNKKYHTPIIALVFTSVLTSIILIAIPNFASVALIASVTGVLPYAAAVLSVIILRAVDKKTKRPFKLPFAKTTTLIGFILSTFIIYWASWPWTVIGSVLLLTGFIAYLFVKVKNWEIKRNIWIIVYLLGIMIVSYLGDPKFAFNNFLPVKPLGLLIFPYDLIILTIFSIFIYLWAYKVNIKAFKRGEQ
ncbi:MAG: amino acid permease [Parachlamydiales bacterium]|nr:amino acid permease [Parachlamydiales bacterium]